MIVINKRNHGDFLLLPDDHTLRMSLTTTRFTGVLFIPQDFFPIYNLKPVKQHYSSQRQLVLIPFEKYLNDHGDVNKY